MLAAVAAVRTGRPSQVVVAVPAGALLAVRALRQAADLVVCPHTPEPFVAVGLAYRDFHQLSDAEVIGPVGCLTWPDRGPVGCRAQAEPRRSLECAGVRWVGGLSSPPVRDVDHHPLTGAGPGEPGDPHRQPGSHAQADGGLALEVPGESDLPEGREALRRRPTHSALPDGSRSRRRRAPELSPRSAASPLRAAGPGRRTRPAPLGPRSARRNRWCREPRRQGRPRGGRNMRDDPLERR